VAAPGLRSPPAVLRHPALALVSAASLWLLAGLTVIDQRWRWPYDDGSWGTVYFFGQVVAHFILWPGFRVADIIARESGPTLKWSIATAVTVSGYEMECPVRKMRCVRAVLVWWPLVLAPLAGCQDRQVLLVRGRVRVLEKPTPERYLAALKKSGGSVDTSAVVATLDSGTTVRLVKTEYFKDYAAYRVELPDGAQGYLFADDSIEIPGGSAQDTTAKYKHSVSH
jgi:hypothetical protein